MASAASQPEGPATPPERFRIEDLLVPSAFPYPVTHLDLKQTPISWVVLTGRFAYKIKKPVHYDFIDASTLNRRKELCEEELRLNRRLAPDLYLDVVPIVRAEGPAGTLRVAGLGTPIEYAVRMHEFDPSQELAEQLSRGTVMPHDINTFAAYLADLHVRAAGAPAESPFGDYELIRRQILDNFEPLSLRLPAAEKTGALKYLRQWTQDSLQRLQPLMESRKRSGFVRECHGDLHARNVVRWRQQWLPFDCLEFDPRLRWIDVMSDVAFLFMDLIAHRREDLAHEYLSRYLEETGDYEGLRLLPLYAVYRALVRAKVDALGAEAAGPQDRQALNARLADRLRVATSFLGAEPPALLIMHGVTACGKSYLSERLVSAINAIRIRSDLERKRLAGVAPFAHRVLGVGEGSYTPAATEETYSQLLACAGFALEAGISVIVDATFLKSKHRTMFRELALQRHCRFLIASCHTERKTLDSRLEMRARSGLDPSEATRAVLEEQLRTQEPLSPEEDKCSLRIDTSWLTSADRGIEALKEHFNQLI